ncbi:mannan endo-1,4-beta-mannosidase 5-like [Senna tora]|uniref:Mannan endo-1,4-beta-mannosidase 5-like n=1 Tax=Senna tora TaxID=362788 RepID=A0A834TQT4_9FABA|nr:mannan endo-1,4-beta-mannosidase 5-like [Senna tora]
MKSWLSVHWTDSDKVLRKPLILGAFGKSSKVARYMVELRDSDMNEVYLEIYKYAKSEGTVGGGFKFRLYLSLFSSMKSNLFALSEIKTQYGIRAIHSEHRDQSKKVSRF